MPGPRPRSQPAPSSARLQLFDRGAVAKSKPWSAASSVPLICQGPGVAQNRIVTSAVSTVDLAPTFLDMAGVLGSAPRGMSRNSLKAALAGESHASLGEAHFGLVGFRGVVRTVDAHTTWKFFCCDTLALGGCPGSTPADRKGFRPDQSEHHLYNISDDRFELPENDLRERFATTVVRQMASLLPGAHVTPANPRSTHPIQGHGFSWHGCKL